MKIIYAIGIVSVTIIIGLLFKVLPTSPWAAFIGWSEFNDYLPYINYFVPVDKIIVISEVWIVAIYMFINVKLAEKAINTVTNLLPFV